MKIIKWICSAIAAVAFVSFAISAALCVPAFYFGFYEYEFEKNDTYNTVQMTEDDLHAVTKHMINYMSDKNDDLNIQTRVNGEQRLFFSDIEIFHMKDVKNLIIFAASVRNISGICFLAAVIIIFLLQSYNESKLMLNQQPSDIRCLCHFIRNVSVVVLGAVIALGVSMWIDFDSVFVMFHQIFFTNEAWILNESVDLLINIVPTPFFIDASILAGIIFAGILLIGILVCSLFLMHAKKSSHLRLTRKSWDWNRN